MMSLAGGVAEVYPEAPSVCEPLGLRIDQLVVSLGMAAPGSDGEQPGGDLEQQARAVFRAMKELVERSGGGLENIAKATAYVRTEQEREPVNGLWWEELFPDPANKPAYKVLVAPLPAGRAIELDVLAVLGATRRRIDVPGVPARDPTVEIGGHVFTSRVHGTVPFTGDQVAAGGVRGQARQAFENVLTLVSLAGGTPADIVSLTSFCRTPSHADPTREALAEIFPDEETRPPLNSVTNFIPSKFDVMVEMAAEVGGKG
jgi:enamine deaminase RidA (YjgF/YER057c/UK114 family)